MKTYYLFDCEDINTAVKELLFYSDNILKTGKTDKKKNKKKRVKNE